LFTPQGRSLGRCADPAAAAVVASLARREYAALSLEERLALLRLLLDGAAGTRTVARAITARTV
jgi:hypothetical protein